MRVSSADWFVYPKIETPLAMQAKVAIEKLGMRAGTLVQGPVPRAVRQTERYYWDNARACQCGDAEIRKLTLLGGTVYVVSGVLSDTGKEVQVFSENGALLATGYKGQGSPHAISWN